MSDQAKVFLTAEWLHLINATYKVPPEILEPHLPNGLELDIIDGSAFVSLVAFDFLNTKVKGIKIPFHVNFPEINLRYYVNHKGRRGVAFIREYVPKFWIAWVARKIYNEPYRKIPMWSNVTQTNEEVKAEHKFRVAGKDFSILAVGDSKTEVPAEDSTAHYFKEHDLGFGSDHSGKTLKYTVEHPVWEIHPLKKFEHNVDFGVVYGEKWAFLNEAEPMHTLIAKGSSIKVFGALPLG